MELTHRMILEDCANGFHCDADEEEGPCTGFDSDEQVRESDGGSDWHLYYCTCPCHEKEY